MTDRDKVEEIRAATREANAALKDLRNERRAIAQMLAGIEGRVQRTVADIIKAEVAEQVAALGRVTERAMSNNVAKIAREFDRLAAIYSGTGGTDRGTLEELTRRYVSSMDTDRP